MPIHTHVIPFNNWKFLLATEHDKEAIDTFLPGTSDALQLNTFFKKDGSFTARKTVTDEDTLRTVICLNIQTIEPYIERGDFSPVYESFFRSCILAIQHVVACFGIYSLNSELRANIMGFMIKRIFDALWEHPTCRHSFNVETYYKEVNTLFHWNRGFIALGARGIDEFINTYPMDEKELEQITSINEEYKRTDPTLYGSVLMNDKGVAMTLSNTVLNRIAAEEDVAKGMATVFNEVCHYSEHILECLSETARSNAEIQIGIASHLFVELINMLCKCSGD